VASECRNVFVEILDDNNNCFAQEGRIVITSLFNKAHPYRYDIGTLGFGRKEHLAKPILKN
jgi:phenylacetate-CoA ligase